jgi:hypothetical protein
MMQFLKTKDKPSAQHNTTASVKVTGEEGLVEGKSASRHRRCPRLSRREEEFRTADYFDFSFAQSSSAIDASKWWTP